MTDEKSEQQFKLELVCPNCGGGDWREGEECLFECVNCGKQQSASEETVARRAE